MLDYVKYRYKFYKINNIEIYLYCIDFQLYRFRNQKKLKP
jgi:hypothetical protein